MENTVTNNNMINLNPKERAKLNRLYTKIKKRQANIDDFKAYERLIEKANLKKKLDSRLQSFGYDNFDQFIEEDAKRINKKKPVDEEKFILAVILAAGLAILLGEVGKKK